MRQVRRWAKMDHAEIGDGAVLQVSNPLSSMTEFSEDVPGFVAKILRILRVSIVVVLGVVSSLEDTL